ncbi:MAG: hypothetical protein RLZZ584_2536 [Pseudomonadota bacterium]
MSSPSLRPTAAACACTQVPARVPARLTPRPLMLALGLLGATGIAHQAAAQTTVATLAQVVVTASRSEQALPDALLSTKVISREQIELSQAADLPALLRTYTAIDVAQSGPPGSQTSLFVRGADSKQVLLVVDGVALNRGDLGTASWQHLALDQIERVEIVRGNASALWGAQAVGGVVQIITRRATQPEFTLGLGSQRSLGGSVAAGQRWGEGERATRASIALSRKVSGGINATDPATGTNPDRDAYAQGAASARIEQGWAAGHASSISLSSTRSKSAYDGFAPGLADQLTTRVNALGLNSRHALPGGLQLDVDLGQTRETYDDPTGPAQFGNSHGSNHTRQGQLQLQWQVAAGQRLVGALERKVEATEDSSTTPASRSTSSLRLGWLGSYNTGRQPIDVQASLRSDDNSLYGRADTGLVALAWTPVGTLKLSAQWSTAFSAPSFSDQQFAAPGLTLRPERSRNIELAAQVQQAAGSLRLAWFRQRQSDRIGFTPTFRTINIARASNQGFELLAQTQLAARTTLSGEAIWQNPRDADSGQPLKRRARQTQSLGLQQGLGAWDLGVALRHSGQRADVDPVTFADATAPARTTLALTGGWKLGPAWRLAARLDNATDNQRPEVLGYTPAQRSLGLSLSGRL